MRRLKTIGLALVGVLVLAFSANAEINIAQADLQRALNESQAGLEAKEALKAEAKKLDEELDAKQLELKKLAEEIEKKKGVWNEETLRQKEKEKREKEAAFQKRFVEYNERLNEKKLRKEGEIIQELRGIVTEVAKKKGLTFVFEKSVGGILYGPPEADITGEVIEIYNQRYKERKANKNNNAGKKP